MWKIFLSSTSRDLGEYRAAVIRAMRKLDRFYCKPMEDFGARSAHALEYCRSAVQECDLFIGILGRCHGSCPDGSALSFTEHEYEAAIAKGMPLLMFVGHEDLPVPAEVVQTPEQIARQRQFRERVQQTSVRDTFSNPEELATAVAAALANFALTAASRRTAWKHGDAPRAADRGALVARMCDRAGQEEQFQTFFAHHARQIPRFPQVIFVRGWERECLDSLVARFCGTTLRRHAERIGGAQQGALDEPPAIEWPVHGGAEILQRSLLERLFDFYDCTALPQDEADAARTLLRLAQSRRYPVVVWRVHLRLGRWGGVTRECLARFLAFWDAVGRASGDCAVPHFFVFIHLAYPEMRGWRRWFSWFLFRPERFEREMLALLNRRQSVGEKSGACCPALLLGELQPVEPHDVLDWFKRHRIFGDSMKVWQRRCDAIFGAKPALPMMEIEDALLGIYEEHLDSTVST